MIEKIVVGEGSREEMNEGKSKVKDRRRAADIHEASGDQLIWK